MAYSDGKIAVVTGAGSGIGRALAQQLNREGCALYLSDINPDTLQDTLASLSRPELRVDARTLDVADRAAMLQWVQDIETAEGYVDIVINNAGVALMARVDEMRLEDLEWLMSINFWGVVYGTQGFLPLLRKAQQGHLVNISSVFGMIGVPTQSAYNAAKFAVRGYTEALRQEMQSTNVHVCCVHPGGVKTNIAGASRGGDSSLTAEDRSQAFHRVARTTSESAAAQIIRAIEKRKKRLMLGWDAKLISVLSRLMPVSYTRLIPASPEQQVNR
ncbi:MAG: SDR family NAD(P)-dependent oxidoreductase [Pseudomonadota bacterium]